LTNNGDEGVTAAKGDEGVVRAAMISGGEEGVTSDGDGGVAAVG
jgi:hypothetical protein